MVLTWNASTDNVGVAGYRVYRNGTLVATKTSPGHTDTGLVAATTYTYSVVAFDVNSVTSGPTSLEAPRQVKSATPVVPPRTRAVYVAP